MIYDAVCNIVEFCSEDGYIHKGLLFKSGDSKVTVIHIHGNCGNFLSFTALASLAEAYQKAGINLLTFNLKAHDCIAEGNWKNGEFDYIGGSLTRFEECYADIDSAIDFCSKFSDKIFLQGHSMGCERAVCYQICRKSTYDMILLAPCDGYALQEKYIAPESVEEQIVRLESVRKEEETILDSEYGIKMDKENYNIPIFRQALLSILKSDAVKVFNTKCPLEYHLCCDCICCIGGQDTLQILEPDKMFDTLVPHFREFKGYRFESDHEFQGHGTELGELLSAWIKRYM